MVAILTEKSVAAAPSVSLGSAIPSPYRREQCPYTVCIATRIQGGAYDLGSLPGSPHTRIIVA